MALAEMFLVVATFHVCMLNVFIKGAKAKEGEGERRGEGERERRRLKF